MSRCWHLSWKCSTTKNCLATNAADFDLVMCQRIIRKDICVKSTSCSCHTTRFVTLFKRRKHKHLTNHFWGEKCNKSNVGVNSDVASLRVAVASPALREASWGWTIGCQIFSQRCHQHLSGWMMDLTPTKLNSCKGFLFKVSGHFHLWKTWLPCELQFSKCKAPVGLELFVH